MKATFIDEAFSKGHFFMSALVIDGSELAKLEKSFEAIMLQLEEQFPNLISSSMELHAGEIFNGKGPWRKAFIGNRQRYEVLSGSSWSQRLFMIVFGFPNSTKALQFLRGLEADRIHFWTPIIIF